jgi:hypothetical protein
MNTPPERTGRRDADHGARSERTRDDTRRTDADDRRSNNSAAAARSGTDAHARGDARCASKREWRVSPTRTRSQPSYAKREAQNDVAARESGRTRADTTSLTSFPTHATPIIDLRAHARRTARGDARCAARLADTDAEERAWSSWLRRSTITARAVAVPLSCSDFPDLVPTPSTTARDPDHRSPRPCSAHRSRALSAGAWKRRTPRRSGRGGETRSTVQRAHARWRAALVENRAHPPARVRLAITTRPTR